MVNNRKKILEKISDKKAEARLKEMGEEICPKAETVAQPTSELAKNHRNKTSFQTIVIDKIAYCGDIELIKEMLDEKEKESPSSFKIVFIDGIAYCGREERILRMLDEKVESEKKSKANHQEEQDMSM